MRVTRHPYDVPGWGVGEVWVRDGVVIQHELASESLRREHEAAAESGGDVAVLLVGVEAGGGGVGTRVGTRAGAAARRDQPEATRHPWFPPMGERGAQRERYRPRRHAIVPASCRICAGGLRRTSRACRRRTTTSRSTSTGRTPLQQEFAAAARAIPWGEVVSYGELAVLAGRPGAARAAGSFCADNRFSLIIPCHRIVAANGIGGYGSAGLGLKRRLLALEGVHL